MARTPLVRFILLECATIILLGETQSRVITADLNVTTYALKGQNEASGMRRFRDRGNAPTDDSLEDRLLQSSDDEASESVVDQILSEVASNISSPYLNFLNSQGGAEQVFHTGTKKSDEKSSNKGKTEKSNAGRILLNVTRHPRTLKIDMERFKDTVQRNIPKLLQLQHNRVHPSEDKKQKLLGYKTRPKFRNRSKRQVEMYMYHISHKHDDGSQHHVSRQVGMETVCSALTGKEEISATPLMCYQCESYSTEKEPRCDVVLWNYLRESEKHYLRIRCPKNRGHYCVKSVSRRSSDYSDRITRRGCVGPGPLPTRGGKGKHIAIREGCISYVEGDYYTTTCFCASDLCNESARLSAFSDGSVLTLILLFWAMLVYALTFSASR